jgi:hypothetical protein
MVARKEMATVAERGARMVSLASLALVALVVSACGMTHQFAPATPTKIVAPAAELELVALGDDGLLVALPDGYATSAGTAVRLRWHAREEGTGIARAFLVPPLAAPCTGGLRAELMAVDGQTRWDRPVGLGVDHDVTLSFPGDPRLEAGPLVLDVEIAGAHGTACARLPVTEAERPLVALSKGVFGFGFSIAVPLRARSSAIVRVDALVGRWIGPVIVGLRLGVGLDPRRVAYGGDGDNSSTSSPARFFELHVAPEVRFFPYVRGTRAVGLSLSFEVGGAVAGAGTATDPERDDTLWGARLGVIFAALKPTPLGAPAHRSRGGRGFELALARLNLTPGEPTRGAAWLLSAGFTAW